MPLPRDGACLVYMATNLINGKRYIGVTGRNLWRRRTEHKCLARRGGQSLFYKALRKYGADLFRFSILTTCADAADALREEARLIDLLKPEYNICRGGGGAVGRPCTERQRETNRRLHSGNRYRLGKPHTVETKNRLRAAASCHLETWERYRAMGPKAIARPVRCLDDGLLHESVKAAGRFYGIVPSSINEVCLGRPWRHTAGGRRFAFAQSERNSSGSPT